MSKASLNNKLNNKRKDYIRLSLKLYRDEFMGFCPVCGAPLQYSTEASSMANKLILRCAGENHHGFEKEIDYSHFYGVINGGKAA